MAKSNSKDVVGMLEDVFSKAPSLPSNIRETLANIAPIISLVFGILGVILGVSGLGLLTAFLPLSVFTGVPGYGAGYLSAGIMLVSSALMLMAYPGLKRRSVKGWNLLFWSEVVSLVSSVLNPLSIVSGIVWALVGFYLLYQIKSYYK